MPVPLVLYSTQPKLAFRINETYYKAIHWIWCSPFLNPNPNGINVHQYPPSAIPGKIYTALRSEIMSRDIFHPYIDKIKVGLLKGISAKKSVGVISQKEHDDLIQVVNCAVAAEFQPLLYIIPYAKIHKIIEIIPPGGGANPFSVEYIIKELPRKSFDVQELPDL